MTTIKVIDMSITSKSFLIGICPFSSVFFTQLIKVEIMYNLCILNYY